MLFPAMLRAQEGSPEVSPPVPGMSWGSPPVQQEWEPTAQGDVAQGTAQGSAHDAQDHANVQVLLAQQVMAEQSKRMADFITNPRSGVTYRDGRNDPLRPPDSPCCRQC